MLSYVVVQECNTSVTFALSFGHLKTFTELNKSILILFHRYIIVKWAIISVRFKVKHSVVKILNRQRESTGFGIFYLTIRVHCQYGDVYSRRVFSHVNYMFNILDIGIKAVTFESFGKVPITIPFKLTRTLLYMQTHYNICTKYKNTTHKLRSLQLEVWRTDGGRTPSHYASKDCVWVLISRLR